MPQNYIFFSETQKPSIVPVFGKFDFFGKKKLSFNQNDYFCKSKIDFNGS